MILVDTSVWISHFQRGNARLASLLDEAQIIIHDFVIGKLACGHLKNRKEILSLLQALPTVSLVSQKELLTFIEKKSLIGCGIGFVDAHLLASCQLAGVFLWTADRPLHQVAQKLKLAFD